MGRMVIRKGLGIPLYNVKRYYLWAKKNWVDYVLSVGGVMFSVSLIPTLLDPAAVIPLSTSVPTALGLGIFALTMHHLKLRFTTVANASTAVLWGLIAVMKHG